MAKRLHNPYVRSHLMEGGPGSEYGRPQERAESQEDIQRRSHPNVRSSSVRPGRLLVCPPQLVTRPSSALPSTVTEKSKKIIYST